MNPSSNEAPNLNLPPPVGGQAPNQAQPGEAAARPAGQVPAGTGQAIPAAAPGTIPAVPAAAAPPIPVSAVPQSAQSDDTSTTKSVASNLLEDKDLIEKEWVNKAKQIVENTQNDPHRQSDELTVVKADYMKKHYNKTIKLSK